MNEYDLKEQNNILREKYYTAEERAYRYEVAFKMLVKEVLHESHKTKDY